MTTGRAATYQYLPETGGDLPRVINDLRRGKLDVAGSVTLANGTTSTDIVDPRLSELSNVILIPRSSAAAAVNWYISSKARAKVVVGHDDPGADREFDWVALG
jgi:hypothetical protein